MTDHLGKIMATVIDQMIQTPGGAALPCPLPVAHRETLHQELRGLRLTALGIAHRHDPQIKRTSVDGYQMGTSVAGAIEAIEEAISILEQANGWTDAQDEEDNAGKDPYAEHRLTAADLGVDTKKRTYG